MQQFMNMKNNNSLSFGFIDQKVHKVINLSFFEILDTEYRNTEDFD